MSPIIETIELQTLASGDRLYLQVYKFKGEKEGKKTYIQANLHGAEIVGNAVIYQLIEFLQNLDSSQIQGEIWLVPVCNPVGVNQRTHFFATGRFNPYDGKDWNRIFWDYEKENPDLENFAKSQIEFSEDKIRENYLQQLLRSFHKKRELFDSQRGVTYNAKYSYILQSLCLDANYIIDLHSASVESIDHLYCFECRQKSAEYFLFDYAILMNKYDGDAFDEAFLKPWLALELQFKKLGREIKFDVEAWTLELGSGMRMNVNSITKGLAGIKNYLVYKEILNLSIKPSQKMIKFIPKYELKSYYAIKGGMIQNRVSLGTKVKVGDKLYEILTFNKSGDLPTIIEIKSEDDGLVYDFSSNEAVNQGEYVLGIFPHV
jgi:predicted deacylase